MPKNRRINLDVVFSNSRSIQANDFLNKVLFPSNNKTYENDVEFKLFLARLSIVLQDAFFIEHDALKMWVEKSLLECKLPYTLCDGIIIPKGVEEFDKALVIDVAEWLKLFPLAQKPYIIALQQYHDNDEPRDIVDNLRKSFRRIFARIPIK